MWWEMGPRSQMQVNPYYQCHAGNWHTKWCHRRDCSTRRRRNEIPQDQDSPPNEYLMHISAHAVSGLVTAGTFSVKVTVGGQTGIALIDTGSSSTFIDLSFAATCHIQKTNSAKIAGGGQLTSGAIIADTAFSIQKHAFNNTLRVLDLKEYDVILGCDWLYKHSPFALNLKTREFLITLEDDTLLSLKDCTSQDAYTEVATEQMNKLLNKGISGFILHLNSLSLQAPHSSSGYFSLTATILWSLSGAHYTPSSPWYWPCHSIARGSNPTQHPSLSCASQAERWNGTSNSATTQKSSHQT